MRGVDLPRYIVTPIASKHRLFFVVHVTTSRMNIFWTVIARDDDVTFGILHSRFHELWSLRLGSALEDRPRYTPTTTFETFPFPVGMTPRETAPAPGRATRPHAAGAPIAAAAQSLNGLREAWLNPPQWVGRAPEVVPGFPIASSPNPAMRPS